MPNGKGETVDPSTYLFAAGSVHYGTCEGVELSKTARAARALLDEAKPYRESNGELALYCQQLQKTLDDYNKAKTNKSNTQQLLTKYIQQITEKLSTIKKPSLLQRMLSSAQKVARHAGLAVALGVVPGAPQLAAATIATAKKTGESAVANINQFKQLAAMNEAHRNPLLENQGYHVYKQGLPTATTASGSSSSLYNRDDLLIAKNALCLTNNNLSKAADHIHKHYSRRFKTLEQAKDLVNYVQEREDCMHSGSQESVSSQKGYGSSCG